MLPTVHLMEDGMKIFKLAAIRLGIFSGLVLFLLGCTPMSESNSEVSDVSSRVVGWLHGNCLAIEADIDLNSYNLVVVDLAVNHHVRKLKIGKKAETADECYALLQDRIAINTENGRRFYTVISTSPINLGIGIVSTGADDNEDNILDINNDGKKDTFSYCSTSEGVKFSIWDGVAYKSELIWSDYYYLGYDTEADCPVSQQLD